MKLHEYQAKDQLARFGIPLLKRAVLDDPCQTAGLLRTLGKGPWVMKAQIHAGGRGKAGGIEIVKTAKEAEAFVKRILGKNLVTPQTGPHGLVVRKILIQPAADIDRELYAAVVMDRHSAKPVLMVSAEGGMDIESLAGASSQKIRRVEIDVVRGLEDFQAREAASAVGLKGDLFLQAVQFFKTLVKIFLSLDANLVEVNPLAVVRNPLTKRAQGRSKQLLAVDVKMSLDDNARFRHPDLFAEEDTTDLSVAERKANQAGVSYVGLNGNIGCLVNGAGLAMATMDIIKLYGGEPANFLDVGGGANESQVAKAFQIILSDKKVKAIFVNIFGGIMRCDVIAKGLLKTVKTTKLGRPLVVRLAGNQAESGRRLLSESGLKIVTAKDFADGAKKAVSLAKKSKEKR